MDSLSPTGVAAEAGIRHQELAQIRAMISGTHEAALLVVGDSGSGKSRLLDFIDDPPGTVVRRIRISPAETDIPLAGLSIITAAFDDPAVGTLSDILLRTSTSAISATSLTAELLSLIRAAGARPTLLIIDDAHFLDDVSRSVLAMMAPRLGGTGLRIVASATEPLGAALASLPMLRLHPLDVDASARLVRFLTGRTADAAMQRMIALASAGNSRAIVGIALQLSGDQLTRAAPLQLPIRLPRRRHDAPAPSVEGPTDPVATLLAQLSLAYLHDEDAVGRDGPEDDAAVEELLADGSVIRHGRYLRLADPVARSTVYWSMEVATRRALHAEAAEAEELREPGLALWHRSWSDPESAPPEELLEHAGRFAREGQVWQAVELAERSLTLGAGRRTLATPLFDLALALLLRGETAFAERYARHCRRCMSGGAPRLTALRTAIDFLNTWRLSAEHAEQSIRADTDPDEAAALLTTLAVLHLERWETARARELLSHATAVLDGASAETVEFHDAADVLRAAIDGDPAPAARMLEQVSRRGSDDVPSPVALILLGRSLTYVDEGQDARRILRTMIDLEPRPDPLLIQMARYCLAELEIRTGNHFEASAVIESAETSPDDTQSDRPLLSPLSAWRQLAMGDEEAAAKLIRECHRRFGMDDPALAARLAVTQGQFALAARHPEDAITHLHNAVSLGAEFRNPALLRCDADLVEAYTLADRMDEAFDHARDFFARSSGFRTPWMLQARARAEALVTPGERSLAVFQRALALASPPDLAFPRARTQLNLAERLADLGRRPEAADQFRAARALFLRLGATTWVARAEPSRVGGHESPRPHPLLSRISDDELRVVELVRQGMRNKDIARALFVSLRTVEVRLTRIYQRVGVTSRAHLISLLADSDRVVELDERTS